MVFFFQAKGGIRYICVTGVQTCALPISNCLRHGDMTTPTRLDGPRDVEIDEVKAGGKIKTQQVARLNSKLALLRDRKSVGEGKSVDLAGRRIINKKMCDDNDYRTSAAAS